MAAGLVAAVRNGFPKPGMSIAPSGSHGDTRFTTGEMVPASCVELDDVVGEDSLILVGRDETTGAVLLKIWMRKQDASPEWGLWMRGWLTDRCRRALGLLR